MSTRTIVVSGAGGSGRTTVAAATALSEARAGHRVLLVAAEDPHRTLDTLLGARLTPRPAPVPEAAESSAAGPHPLHALRLDPEGDFAEEAGGWVLRAKPLFDLLGAAPLEREEFTAPPGAPALALLRALRRHAASGDWDTVVVDGPATPALIAAFALPEQLGRYLARLLPQERRTARALRPVLAALAGVPMPADWLFDAAARAETELAALRAAVDDPGLSVRPVLLPGERALSELRLDRAGLALFGRRVDAVAVNRLLPSALRADADAGPEFGAGGSASDAAGHAAFAARLGAAQRARLAALRAEVETWGAAVHALPHLGHDPHGLDDLTVLADALPCPQAGPGASASAGAGEWGRWEVADRLAEDGLLLWRIPLPGAVRSDLDLVRRGDELLLGVGPYRRTVRLPSALRRCTVAGAGLADGVLTLRFRPDPGLWPQTLRR